MNWLLIGRGIVPGRAIPALVIPVPPEVDDLSFVHQPTLPKEDVVATIWTDSQGWRVFARFYGSAVS